MATVDNSFVAGAAAGVVAKGLEKLRSEYSEFIRAMAARESEPGDVDRLADFMTRLEISVEDVEHDLRTARKLVERKARVAAIEAELELVPAGDAVRDELVEIDRLIVALVEPLHARKRELLAGQGAREELESRRETAEVAMGRIRQSAPRVFGFWPEKREGWRSSGDWIS